jgi:hypothetical protein
MTDILLNIFMIVFSALLGLLTKNVHSIKEDNKRKEKELAAALEAQRKKNEDDQKAMFNASKVLLLNELNKSQSYYMRLNHCPPSEKRIVCEMYDNYKALGGNGLADKLWTDIINLNDFCKEA